MTDWSRQGIGFVMCQKYCSCPTTTPLCCKTGWKVCMVGSSFLSPAEQNYSPIEGEGLAVVNALHKTRHYTQGCDKLLVCTDHKPLVPVMSTKTLENIENPRLMRLVQKTLSWRFLIIHIPGKLLAGPDTLSIIPRQPGPSLDGALQEEKEQLMACKEARIHMIYALRVNSTNSKPDPDLDVSDAVLASMELGIRSITWDMVKQQLLKDETYSDLSSWITSGCKGPTEDLPPHIKPYWKLRNDLHCVEYVPMFNDRTIIPTSMRKQVI